jgi:nitroimidazol reductase NimA-like FMN-containing flavoprotein (pyridoxamine 5'-phosphate oxidase superfamily)
MTEPRREKKSQADTRLRRLPERGSHDFDLACEIIDAARIAHVGFTLEGQPYVVPMAIGRMDSNLLLHGSVVSRLITNLADGLPCCVTVTHLDGLVLARSAFHSSMNYRSAMVFGNAVATTEPDEKLAAFDALVEHLAPGRLADLRASSRKEINATTILRLPIETFSVKQRTGPPNDASYDVDLPVWAGVIPISLSEGEPVNAPDLPDGIALPEYLR